MDYNTFNGYSPYAGSENIENQYADFNPMSQYEQGYMYYKFLTQQLEYKIKCKEFEKMCNDVKEKTNERRVC